MQEIESIYAAYEISELMMNAKESINLYAPDGWQFFSFGNYPPVLHEAAELNLNTRFIFGADMFPAELDPYRHLPERGCQIRIEFEPQQRHGYVIADSNRAITGKYIPTLPRHDPYRLFTQDDGKEVANLKKHFDVVWDSAMAAEVLFPLSNPTSGKLIVPSISDIVGWSPRFATLAVNPAELFKLKPRDFEELIAELLHRDGFETTLTPPTRDGGRDILAHRILPTGPMLCLVECKRYAPDQPVSVEFVRALFGVVHDDKASSGLIVTTSSFTNPAREFAARHTYRLHLKEHDDLVAWIKRTAGMSV